MPLYEYSCPICGKKYDAFCRNINEFIEPIHCGVQSKRLISQFTTTKDKFYEFTRVNKFGRLQDIRTKGQYEKALKTDGKVCLETKELLSLKPKKQKTNYKPLAKKVADIMHKDNVLHTFTNAIKKKAVKTKINTTNKKGDCDGR